MKPIRALLLSVVGAAIVTGTSVQVSAQSTSSRVPKEPPSTTLVVQTSTTISATTPEPAKVTAQSIQVPRVLTAKFEFGERSKRVALLQEKLGGLKVDGYYGKLTRSAHIRALKSVGLPTNIVPKIIANVPVYNISTNFEERCPQFEAKFREYGLKPVEVFSYLAWRESKCSVGAINARFDSKGHMVWTLNANGTFDSGLLQINSSWRTVTAQVCNSKLGDLSVLLKLDCNLKMAKYLLDETSGGLRNWRIYRRN